MPAEPNRSRMLNRFAIALSVIAIAMLAYLAFPLLPGFPPKTTDLCPCGGEGRGQRRRLR